MHERRITYLWAIDQVCSVPLDSELRKAKDVSSQQHGPPSAGATWDTTLQFVLNAARVWLRGRCMFEKQASKNKTGPPAGLSRTTQSASVRTNLEATGHGPDSTDVSTGSSSYFEGGRKAAADLVPDATAEWSPLAGMGRSTNATIMPAPRETPSLPASLSAGL